VRLNLVDIGMVSAPLFLVLMMFFLPISPTLLSICLGVGSLILISIPYYRRISFYTWGSWSGLLAIGLFVFILIASLWSPASVGQKFSVISKYFKLFYLPIVAVSFINPKMRQWSLNAYLFGMMFTCCYSIALSQGLIPFNPDVYEAGGVFHNHIITSFMMAFASYLSGLFLLKYKGWARAAYLMVFLLSSYQIIFINTGRTGYLIYFVLMSLLLLQKFSWKQAMTGLVLFCGLMALCYKLSPVMNQQIDQLVNEVQMYTHNQEENSVGLRIQFHQYSRSLLNERPLLGIGTGAFKYRFSQDNPVPSWGANLNEPHSQYWMLLAEHGLVGFSLFCFFLLSLVFLAFRLKEMRPILLGFTVVFSIICLTDTVFSYSVIGYLMIMIIAISFGELHELREARESAS